MVTVKHNGVVVHDKRKLNEPHGQLPRRRPKTYHSDCRVRGDHLLHEYILVVSKEAQVPCGQRQ